MKTENQTTFIVLVDKFNGLKVTGFYTSLMLRGTITPHSRCNATHEHNISERIFWDKGENMNAVEGVIVEKYNRTWDYSKPVGERGTDILKSEGFDQKILEYIRKR